MVLGHEPGTEVRIGITVDERRVGRDLVTAHRHKTHGLGAAGDDGRREAAHDALGGERDSLEARRTEAIDGDRGRGNRDAGAKTGDAGDVQALLRLGHGTSQNHILDLGRIDARRAPQRLGDRRRGELVWPRPPQRAVGGLANGRAHSRNDDRLVHISSLRRLNAELAEHAEKPLGFLSLRPRRSLR